MDESEIRDRRSTWLSCAKEAFQRAGFQEYEPELIPNEYWPEAYRDIRESSPWLSVLTEMGIIKVGWRKRVIELDWSRSRLTALAEEIFPKASGTKGDHFIHAWGYDSLAGYLECLRESAKLQGVLSDPIPAEPQFQPVEDAWTTLEPGKSIKDIEDQMGRAFYADVLRLEEENKRLKTQLNSIKPRWVVNSLGELGVKIEDRFFFFYKGESLEYTHDPYADPEERPLLWRHVLKREFGEVCQPHKPVSLEDGQDWQPLPLPKKET